MKTPASTRSLALRSARSHLCLAAAVTLIAACSPPVEPMDGGSDAVADGATNNDRDANRSDIATDSAADSATGNDGNTNPSDATSDDVASDGATVVDSSALDASVADVLSMDAIADSARDAIADSAPDAMPDSRPDAIADSAPDVSCSGSQRLCSGRCVDTQSDILNCGACGMVCPMPPTGTVACNAGVCGALAGSRTTQPAGMATPVQLGQPTLALTMVVATTGVFPSRDAFASGTAVGMVHLFAGNFGPDGAPIAQGQLISIASNTALFSLLGTTYGGDGRATFALPDLRDRMLVGQGMGMGLPDAPLGVVFGSTSATLTIGTMPGHSHLLVDGVTRTSTTGRGEAFDHRAPSLPITAWVATEGLYPSASAGSNESPFMGEIRWFAGNFTPTGGWAPADGRLLSIAEFSALFSILGTTYGGNGTTTFAVPDLRGRAPIGTGAAAGGPTIALGQTVGASSTTLNATQLPSHQHDLVGGGATQTTGMGQPFSAYQPSLGVTWLISTQGIYPARDGSGSFNDVPYIGEVIAFAGNFAPRGYLKAEGQLLSIAMNTALFSILGTTYGGDGRVSFALPDLRGRAPRGTSAMTPLGAQSGAPTRTLVTANLPSHTHTY